MEEERCCKAVVNKNNLSFPRNVVGNLPLSKLLLKEEKQFCFNRKVEDPRQKHSGMTPNLNNNAFTLIELLVVVLIIGILAAVAVPQYQKAVYKSRFVQTLTITNSLYQAALRYHLANGTYPTQADELDISFGSTRGGIMNAKDHQCYVEKIRVYCMSTRKPLLTFHLFYDGKVQCCTYGNDNFAADVLCAEQTGKKPNQWQDGGGGSHCFLRNS